MPFDQEASKLAKYAGIEVANINGKSLGELQKYLNSEPFQGTLMPSLAAMAYLFNRIVP